MVVLAIFVHRETIIPSNTIDMRYDTHLMRDPKASLQNNHSRCSFLLSEIPAAKITINAQVYYWLRHVQKQFPRTNLTGSSRPRRLIIILLIVGGIETNPSPHTGKSTRYPWGVCSKEVKDTGERATCSTCDTWSHKCCRGMDTHDFENFANSSIHM